MVTLAEEQQSSLKVERTVEIDAPLKTTFEAVLQQLGPRCEYDDGTPLPMKLEPWPGGRWFRDLGDSAGHWWGTVQVIKPPTLIEISGPLFMSYPALSHLQYRLTEQGDQTILHFTHRAIGELNSQHAKDVSSGWDHQIARIVAAVS